TDVFARDLVDALANVFQEFATGDFLVCIVSSGPDATKIFQRKFRVDGDAALRQLQQYVDRLARAKVILRLVLLTGEGLPEQAVQLQLPKAAAEFGRAQDTFQVRS